MKQIYQTVFYLSKNREAKFHNEIDVSQNKGHGVFGGRAEQDKKRSQFHFKTFKSFQTCHLLNISGQN